MTDYAHPLTCPTRHGGSHRLCNCAAEMPEWEREFLAKHDVAGQAAFESRQALLDEVFLALKPDQLTDVEKALRRWVVDHPEGGRWWVVIKSGFRRSVLRAVDAVMASDWLAEHTRKAVDAERERASTEAPGLRPHHYMNADGFCHAGDMFEAGSDFVTLYAADEVQRHVRQAVDAALASVEDRITDKTAAAFLDGDVRQEQLDACLSIVRRARAAVGSAS